MKSEKWIVCRVCLEQPKETMHTIFSQNSEQDLTRMILECGGVPIKKYDHFPDKICSKCLKLLRLAYRFRTICQKSYKHLSRLMAPIEVESNIENLKSETIIEQQQQQQQQRLEQQETEQQTELQTQKIQVTRTEEIPSEAEEAPPEEIILKIDPDEIQEEFYIYEDDVLDEHIEELKNVEEETVNSELSAEIEFLDDVEEEIHLDTSDDEFLPISSRATLKRKRTEPRTVKAAATTTTATNSTEAVDSNTAIVAKENTASEVITHETDIIEEDPHDMQQQPIEVVTDGEPTRPRVRTVRGKREKLKYICDICGNLYPSQSRLTEHIKLHSGIKPHECEICGHRFSQTQQLARHMNTHTGNRPYKCNYCTAAFADLSTRNKHHRIHTNERPYVCDVCGKSFTYTNTLKFHKMMHTGEKPFACDICGKAFQQAYKLRNHKATHMKRQRNARYENALVLERLELSPGGTLLEL